MTMFSSLSKFVVTTAVAAALTLPGLVSAQEATPVPYSAGTDLAALSGTITMDGSSTVYPLGEALGEEFKAIAAGVDVVVDFSGTGGGFKRFCEGGTDFSNASRPIKDEEAAICAEAGINYYEFEIAYDGLSIVVNPENDFLTCLTVAQLNQMWAPGAVDTKWSDINASWPEEVIELYGPGTDSGTFDYFTEVINGETGASTEDYLPSEDDNQLVEGVAGDANGLGYFGLSYYEQNSDRLKLVEVDGGSGCIAPSNETVQNLTYTPLSRPLFIYVSEASLARPEVQEFTRFALASANIYAEEVGIVDSPLAVYAEDQAKLESAIAGTGSPDGPIVEATPAS